MTVLTVVYRRKDSFVECVLHTHACTHTHMRARAFNGPFSNTIQYNIRLLEAVRMQRRTIIEREKYVENENVKMVHNE